MGSETRQRTTHILIRVSPEEKEAIQTIANQCDLTVPAYLRTLGLGFQPHSTLDAKAFEQLAHLHGDIGRVGGLLKLWLSKKSLKAYGESLGVPDLVKQILELKKKLLRWRNDYDCKESH